MLSHAIIRSLPASTRVCAVLEARSPEEQLPRPREVDVVRSCWGAVLAADSADTSQPSAAAASDAALPS